MRFVCCLYAVFELVSCKSLRSSVQYLLNRGRTNVLVLYCSSEIETETETETEIESLETNKREK